ncbi:glycoside hydrolase [Mycobacterium sp. ACS1612]|uniref:glycoside hydrolase family 2 protein n=1 Tax=Mycobacterium sp. ACS1612 TaxID=1834117 RepID=UPI0007FDC806|nr:sugar-binding domain-containing protein [Mycobacterium sp. ACS1612]OBF33727.1 glycoside hydrolase [Mycobacterium sp. ACS1612]
MLLCAADFPDFAKPGPPPGQIELAGGWSLVSARDVHVDGAALSRPDYKATGWHAIPRMPATVLQTLQQDGTYPDLYYGTNMASVPQDLYKQDWWYRTTFAAPAGHTTYLLEFPGINYRAEIWLNGHLVAGSDQIVGMHVSHEVDVSRWVNQGQGNALAVKITPERALQDIDGVELADSWYDWINWKYIGYQGPGKNPANGNSFVPDRNAGIWKPVYLRTSGAVALGPSTVNSELPLPRTDSAKLTIYSSLRNTSDQQVRGVLRATISRPGKPDVVVEQPETLAAGEYRDVSLSPDKFAQLTVRKPDLWWPYTMGRPDLYDLRLEFRQFNRPVDIKSLRFGIRSVQQFRDNDEQFPDLGKGGNFYLKVNGKDFLVRGAAYTPDLLYASDPNRDAAILGYVKDLGLNMIRLEGKFPGDRITEMADEMGIPLMYGWMCCNQWEKWNQWDDEDKRVAPDSLRSQIEDLRSHPSAFVWANGSDGKPPQDVLAEYHGILSDLHWPNAIVDTVSSLAVDPRGGDRDWDGIQMLGPYSWRPPSYWFSGRYPATRGATAEQGDNEQIPPFASLKKFIPPDKLWPINDTWYFHAGSDVRNSTLTSIRRAVDRRYGTATGAEDFARKAQLAGYESTRAQFEAFAAGGWDNHKMTIYWMLNNHWPSFFGHIFDYYLRPGGAYYGAKKGLRPLSVVFDSYATGDHDHANVTVVNQTPREQTNLTVRVRTYDLRGRIRDDRSAGDINVIAGGATHALTLPRLARDSSVVFVRAQLLDKAGKAVAENVYWQSQQLDDIGDPSNDFAFELKQTSWADMTGLNYMPKVPLDVSASRAADPSDNRVTIRLHNPSPNVAFFERAELVSTPDGDEILPVEYSDNYVTVFPGETVELHGQAWTGVTPNWVRVTGYNTPPQLVPIN